MLKLVRLKQVILHNSPRSYQHNALEKKKTIYWLQTMKLNSFRAHNHHKLSGICIGEHEVYLPLFGHLNWKCRQRQCPKNNGIVVDIQENSETIIEIICFSRKQTTLKVLSYGFEVRNKSIYNFLLKTIVHGNGILDWINYVFTVCSVASMMKWQQDHLFQNSNEFEEWL